MTDKEFSALRAKLRKLAKKWIPRLNLDQWAIQLTYDREGFASANNGGNAGAATCLARTGAMWQYLDAHIEFNMPVLLNCSDWEIEVTYVHELMHLLLNEMREEGINHEERTATTLARAFVKTSGLAT
jgi:hypothetical protein